ncbi:hypothetical protein [Parafrankia discariae]|uniref:hypothetical protein n=1 Tax=Parafrankia discariae TaxID=365528 RepID=UPI000368C3F9|nr:hypothetical protein [Parafrankia discariae]
MSDGSPPRATHQSAWSRRCSTRRPTAWWPPSARALDLPGILNLRDVGDYPTRHIVDAFVRSGLR